MPIRQLLSIKVTVKFRASRRLRFEDAKKIMSPEMGPKSFGTFEKQAPGRDLGSRKKSTSASNPSFQSRDGGRQSIGIRHF